MALIFNNTGRSMVAHSYDSKFAKDILMKT